MWQGDYNFFDYKGNIVGYEGQDYMSPIQYIMCGIAMLFIIFFLIIFRNAKKDHSKKFFLISGIFMTAMYIAKTTWESYWDIKLGHGFNLYILPFDTCSLIMPALLIAGLAKKDSKLERLAATFMSTVGFAGGVANFIFLRGLNYYPMFAFGGLYSYFWHVNMLFFALFIPVTSFIDFKWKDIFNGMGLLLFACVIVVPFNYIMGYDYMQLNGAGGVPLVEGLAGKLIDANLRPLATLLMLVAYLGVCGLMVSIYKGCKALVSFLKKRKAQHQY